MCAARYPSNSSPVNTVGEDEASGSNVGPEGWKKTMERLAGDAAARPQDWSWQQVVELSKSMSEAWIRTKAGIMAGSVFDQRVEQDHLSCRKCGGVLHKAVTLDCGYSFCHRCATGGTLPCCPYHLDHQMDAEQLKDDVTVAPLVEKWWPAELKAVDLRLKGNVAIENHNYQEALQLYSDALQSNPADFASLSNRSHLFFVMNRFEEALQDAYGVVRIRPDWPKGYFRQYKALKGLGRREEAVIALFCSAAVEQTLLPGISKEIAKLLHEIITSVVMGTDRVSSEDVILDPHQASGSSIPQDPIPHVTANPLPSSEETQESCGDEELRNTPEQMADSLKAHQRNESLHKLVDRIVEKLNRFSKSKLVVALRTAVSAKVIQVQRDFECTVCSDSFLDPVTTRCGHTFCINCLDQAVQPKFVGHKPKCPLCNISLAYYQDGTILGLNLFLHHVMTVSLRQQYDEIPIFICVVALPTVPCPLHDFGLRNSVTLHRCMDEWGSRQFGMCSPDPDQEFGFAGYGTMFEVYDVVYPDKTSIIGAPGGRRFKVLRRGEMYDGYCIANVEFLTDEPVEDGEKNSLIALHEKVHHLARDWVENLDTLWKTRVVESYGTMPIVEPDWIKLPDGPKWLWWILNVLQLDTNAKVAILSMTKLENRLREAERGIIHH